MGIESDTTSGKGCVGIGNWELGIGHWELGNREKPAFAGITGFLAPETPDESFWGFWARKLLRIANAKKGG